MTKSVQMWTGQRAKYFGVPLQKSFQKQSDGTLIVRGFFTSDNKDEVGDIITRTATERALPKYRQWGNIRRMHMPDPVGVVLRIGTEDGLEWNEVEIRVVDPKAVFEVEQGLLKALSVGILFTYEDIDFLESGGLIINDYMLAEISLVDHPANYDAALKTAGAATGVDYLVRQYGMDAVARSFQTILEKELSGMENDAKDIDQAEVQETLETIEAPEEEAVPAPQVEVEAPAAEEPAVDEPVAEPAPEVEDEMKSLLRALVSKVDALTEAVSVLQRSPEAPAQAPEPEQSVGEEMDKSLASDVIEPGAPVNRVGGVEATELPSGPDAQKVVKYDNLRDAITKMLQRSAGI